MYEICDKECQIIAEICALKNKVLSLDEKTSIYEVNYNNYYTIKNGVLYCTCDSIDKTMVYNCSTGECELTEFDFGFFFRNK